MLKNIKKDDIVMLTNLENNILKAAKELSAISEEKIKTNKEERLRTGLDLTGKKTFTDKGEIFNVFIKAFGVVMDYGANKYDYSNFESAPFVYEDVLDCLMRHWISFKQGEIIDPESQQLHIGHIISRAAIAVLKSTREKYDNEEASRFIGWNSDELVEILNEKKDIFPNYLYSEIKPKHIPFSTHITSEMFAVVAESPFYEIKDKYTFNSWCKTFETFLVSFIISNINGGETSDDKILHSKLLLWVAINIYYYESKYSKVNHNGYYR